MSRRPLEHLQGHIPNCCWGPCSALRWQPPNIICESCSISRRPLEYLRGRIPNCRWGPCSALRWQPPNIICESCSISRRPLEHLRGRIPNSRWGPCSALRCSLLSQIQPRLDYCIRIEREAFDALVDQPLSEVRMVRRSLSAYTAVLARFTARVYRQM